jgi:preprotein translocase subunit SecE
LQEHITVFAKLTKFIKEVELELRRVTWPSRNDLIGSTRVVIVVSLIMAIFIGVVDRILTEILKLVVR